LLKAISRDKKLYPYFCEADSACLVTNIASQSDSEDATSQSDSEGATSQSNGRGTSGGAAPQQSSGGVPASA